MPPPTIISFDWPGTAPAHTTNAQTLQDCDCLVIGCCSQDIFSADKSGAPEMSNSATQQLLSLLEQLPPYAAVYSICSFEGTEPDEALACSTALATIARDCWMGGVTIGGAELTGYLSHQPRMGILRRPISETLDALIAAVRSQTELEGSDRSNLLSARPGIPKPFWRMACNLLVENQRRQ